MRRPIGIFGGSFDPVHFGHLRTAEVVREAFGLERVLFVPNQVSPFKESRAVTPGAQRAEMILQAIQGNAAFALWGGELERPGPSYTVETLRTLAREMPDADLHFLTGTDAVRDLAQWREPEALLALARFIAVVRPGVAADEARTALPADWLERIDFADLPGLEISSTEIRRRVGEARSIRYLTPDPVIAYIARQGLYAPPARRS